MNIVRPDDERFAEFLQTALRDAYTPMPEVPREEMWASIVARRQGIRIADTGVAERAPIYGEERVGSPQASTRDVISIDEARQPVRTPRPHRVVPVRWALPIAAGLLVAGIGFGWQAQQHRDSSAQSTETVAATRVPPGMPTRVAAEQHFTEVEHLLTAFATAQRSGTEDAAFDAKVSAWARDLLSTTQLLLDSPMGMDPQQRKLLTDVELVLVQLTQLAPHTLPDDRDFVQQSITHSQMMQRLQDVAPAGAGATPAAPLTPAETKQDQ
jgi:hypothetical protein